MIVLLSLLVYFLVLLAMGRWTSRQGSNETFFRGERKSPWRMVAFGMVGASISGVTFLSVPGMVLGSGMAYLQLCLGFILGYLAVAFVLLPVYYRLNLTSIYAYLGDRLGGRSYLTGAGFFLLSKMIGTAVKFYVACIVLQQFVMDDAGVPFIVTVCGMVLLIWLYTNRGGVRTLVFTDTLQTLCLLATLLLIICLVMQQMGLSLGEAVSAVAGDGRSRIFVFDDWESRQNFWKQLLSGAFIVVVMTGLDQDMMQKNLTCRSLGEAQKNMCSYGVAFVPVNLLFLSLGVLLAQHFESRGIALPTQGDLLLPMFVQDAGGLSGYSSFLIPLFTLGIVASSFSSADSALTALTTSYCIDIRRRPQDERLRRRTHAAMCVLLAACIFVIQTVNSTSLIDAIYTIVSYTYGPLLGLFAYGLFTHRQVNDRLVPFVCVLSPLACFAVDVLAQRLAGYHWGYELLLLNGLFTFVGLWLVGWMKRPMALISLLMLICCTSCSTLRSGDLLFHIVEQPNHITSVTSGKTDHVAIYLGNDAVVEAIPGRGVVVTPMDTLLQRESGCYVRGRVKGADRRRSLQRALACLGQPYDSLFLPDNKAMYCSELVVQSFTDRHGRLLLEQVPMTFTDSTGRIPPYWLQLYARHGMEVPQGKPGSNPSELSRRQGVVISSLAYFGGRKKRKE